MCAMILSARSIVPPVVITIFTWKLFCFDILKSTYMNTDCIRSTDTCENSDHYRLWVGLVDQKCNKCLQCVEDGNCIIITLTKHIQKNYFYSFFDSPYFSFATAHIFLAYFQLNWLGKKTFFKKQFCHSLIKVFLS